MNYQQALKNCNLVNEMSLKKGLGIDGNSTILLGLKKRINFPISFYKVIGSYENHFSFLM